LGANWLGEIEYRGKWLESFVKDRLAGEYVEMVVYDETGLSDCQILLCLVLSATWENLAEVGCLNPATWLDC
jgi:hypothetical protein